MSAQYPYQGQPQAPVTPGATGHSPSAGPIAVGPFTLRELIVIVVGVFLFVNSFLPLMTAGYSGFSVSATVWSDGFITGIAIGVLPLAVAALLLMRRLAPATPLRLGSLSVDQFASVISVVLSVYYLKMIFSLAAASVDVGIGTILGLIFSLVALALTVFSYFIPVFKAEFTSRNEVVAHPIARPVQPLPARVVPQQQYAQPGAYAPNQTGPVGGYAQQAPADQNQTGAYNQATGQFAPAFGAQPDVQAAPSIPTAPAAPQHEAAPANATPAPAAQAFWIAVPEQRDVVDELTGAVLFAALPGGWILATEDRGDALVVRHEDGRTGILRNVAGVHRA
ncbi:hypothetical protein [Lysinibacter cavernae]|uniref:Uncharacterized protein n=1 Tax=Lysinibacter cavernae TaxID=1640652 RepID=A0A7X5R1M0_9MICO|nr:hypothetical protein [Lysinibacter cavernae]NIH53906.1 hypothetical protein [Lysinibacter cavernae]